MTTAAPVLAGNHVHDNLEYGIAVRDGARPKVSPNQDLVANVKGAVSRTGRARIDLGE